MPDQPDPTRLPADAPVADLIDACLAAGGPDRDAWWRGVEALRARGGRDVLDAALALCREADALARTLGLDILNQFGAPQRPYRDEIVPILFRALDDDAAGVRQAAVTALGFEEDPRIVPALCGRRDDPDPEVRYAITVALGQRADDPMAIDGLVALAHDERASVRDWATFGLGTLSSATTPALIAALVERAADPDAQTRDEALAGLERRKGDGRVVEALAQALGTRSVGQGLLLAAARLADPRLLPSLLRVNAWSDAETLLLEAAIHACSGDDDEAGEPPGD
jgi:HEAT repeats